MVGHYIATASNGLLGNSSFSTRSDKEVLLHITCNSYANEIKLKWFIGDDKFALVIMIHQAEVRDRESVCVWMRDS